MIVNKLFFERGGEGNIKETENDIQGSRAYDIMHSDLWSKQSARVTECV